MTRAIRSMAVLAATVCLAGSMGFAETGESIYKANCQSSHGSTGTPSAGIAKMMAVKPAAEYKTSEKEQIESVKNGKGKMKAFAVKLTDDQNKDKKKYFRSLK